MILADVLHYPLTLINRQRRAATAVAEPRWSDSNARKLAAFQDDRNGLFLSGSAVGVELVFRRYSEFTHRLDTHYTR